MKSTILKRVFIVFSIFLLSFFIASCKAKEEYVENPYFQDTSDDTFSSFSDTFDLYLDELFDYYDETYMDIFFIIPFAYQFQEGFTPIPDQSYYTKTEIAVNDHLIDERSLFLRSGMKSVLDNDHLTYIVIDDYYSCKENTICGEEDTDNYLQFSIHEDQIYFAYRVRYAGNIVEYMYYITKDSNQKIHLEFLYSITDLNSNDIDYVQYVLYDEDVKELNMSYDGWARSISYYDIATKEKIESSFGLWSHSTITYYDPELETEFTCDINDDGIIGDSRLTQFEQNHIKLTTNDVMSDISIRLNQIEGWNRVKPEGNANPHTATLYLDDIIIDDTLIVRYDKNTGNVILDLESITSNIPVSENLISLEAYGLDSGYDYATINELFDDFKANVVDLLERFDLNHSSDELIQRFIDTTGIEID